MKRLNKVNKVVLRFNEDSVEIEDIKSIHINDYNMKETKIRLSTQYFIEDDIKKHYINNDYCMVYVHATVTNNDSQKDVVIAYERNMEIKDIFMSANRRFGDYTIMIDTVKYN